MLSAVVICNIDIVASITNILSSNGIFSLFSQTVILFANVTVDLGLYSIFNIYIPTSIQGVYYCIMCSSANTYNMKVKPDSCMWLHTSASS